jgi:hypothetical protein
MRTQIITQVLTALAVAGLSVSGTSDAQSITGERALLNRVWSAPVAASATAAENGPIDPANALLGRSTERSGFRAMSAQESDVSPAKRGAERALLGRDG